MLPEPHAVSFPFSKERILTNRGRRYPAAQRRVNPRRYPPRSGQVRANGDAARPCPGGGVTTAINGRVNGRSMALVLLENGLSLDLDLDLFADHHAAGNRCVEADAEIAAVDL